MEVKKERGWGTASPFSLSRFSPPPPPPLFLHLPRRVYGDVLSVQTVKKCNMVVRDFWNRSFSRTEFSDLSMSNSDIFLDSTGNVSCLISQIFLHKHMDPGERKLTVLRVRR